MRNLSPGAPRISMAGAHVNAVSARLPAPCGESRSAHFLEMTIRPSELGKTLRQPLACARGSERPVTSYFSEQRYYIHADIQRMFRSTQQHAVDRADIAVVAAPRDRN